MKKRPLSPHLQIYRWQWTMVGSILHRISGVATSISLVLASIALWLLATNDELLLSIIEAIPAFMLYGMFMIALFFLFYHLSNGVRHLLWDLGYNFSLHKAKLSGRIAFVMAFVLSFLAMIMMM